MNLNCLNEPNPVMPYISVKHLLFTSPSCSHADQWSNIITVWYVQGLCSQNNTGRRCFHRCLDLLWTLFYTSKVWHFYDIVNLQYVSCTCHDSQINMTNIFKGTGFTLHRFCKMMEKSSAVSYCRWNLECNCSTGCRQYMHIEWWGGRKLVVIMDSFYIDMQGWLCDTSSLWISWYLGT